MLKRKLALLVASIFIVLAITPVNTFAQSNIIIGFQDGFWQIDLADGDIRKCYFRQENCYILSSPNIKAEKNLISAFLNGASIVIINSEQTVYTCNISVQGDEHCSTFKNTNTTQL